MNEQLPMNRVEMELNQWRSREERFSKLFNFSLSNNRSLIKEKLHHYERIGTKYKGTKNIEERFALQMLKQERNKILKQLYPNLLVRLVRKLLIAPLIDQIAVRKDAKEEEKNNQSLNDQVQRIGFRDLSNQIEQQIKQGNRLPVTLIKNGNEHRFYIEANPQFKSVNIYDEHSRKITLSTALGNKPMETVKQLQKSNEHHQQNHSKRNGMRIS